jgi:hypothetical protein
MAGIADFRKRRDERNGLTAGAEKPKRQTPEEKGNAAAKAKAKAEEAAKTDTVADPLNEGEPEFDPQLFKKD